MIENDMQAFDEAEKMFRCSFTPRVEDGRTNLQERRKLLKRFLDSRGYILVVG